jgi:parallel beta-helix repeat protein
MPHIKGTDKNTIAEIASATTRGDTFYVSTAGNDSNSGLNWNDSLLTIDAAIAKCTANAGDVIRVASGAYDENANTGGVLVDVDGITIIGENETEDQAATTVVNSNGAATAVFTVSADNVVLENIAILETTATVEGIVSSGDYCLFVSLQLNGAMENGIHLAAATQNTVRDCKVIGCTNDGIELSGATTGCVIDGGSISSVGDNGIHFNGDAADQNIVKNLQIFGVGVTTNGIHINAADSNMITQSVEINECTVGVLLAAGSNNNTINANIVCTTDYTDNSGVATNNFLGSITYLQENLRHVPKFSGQIWFVDGTNGADTNSGMRAEEAFATIGAGITASSAGDRIYVRSKTTKYDETGLDMNLQGLELYFEPGAILEDTTPGTVLTVSAQDCKLHGVFIDNDNNGGIGFNVTTAASIYMCNCTAMQCTTGFMLDGVKGVFDGCSAIDNSVTGFDIQTLHATFKDCVANGNNDAVRGFYLSDNTADLNTFINCHSVSNTTAGWETVAGADNNTFARCSMGGTDGAKVDAGTSNTWPGFSIDSQIVAGQSVAQDLKDIFDDTQLILADTGTDGVVLNSKTAAFGRLAGETQIIEVSITAAANAGVTTVATATTQPCLIKSTVIHADAGQTADMTSCALEGGTSQVVEFIGSGVATQANLDAADKQVAWTGAVRLAATKTIAIDLQGTGATAVDLTVTIEYEACVDGGYLA